jgi:uncharacterized protein
MHRNRFGLLIWVLCVTYALCLTKRGAAADAALLNAVREDDAAVVSRLLASGADANIRDEIGATALMHAAAFSSAETVRVLLERGADVNATTKSGATALMWATGDIAKVRLLLDRGARVDVMMKDGTTTLVTAARRGSLDVMRLLLARGANPRNTAGERTELLRLAFGDHPEIGQVLRDAGIELKSLITPGEPWE